MKKIIGSLLLVVGFAFNAYAQGGEEIRADILAKTEAEMSQMLMNEIFLPRHQKSQSPLIEFLDGGRAAVESGKIVKSIQEFQELLLEILSLGEQVNDFKDLPGNLQEAILNKIEGIRIAIEAVPNTHKGMKKPLLDALANLQGMNRGDRSPAELVGAYSKLATVLTAGLAMLTQEYQNVFALEKGKVKPYAEGLSNLEKYLRYDILASLVTVVKKHGLNDSEIEKVLIDLGELSNDFKGLKQFLIRKLSFEYGDINFFEHVSEILRFKVEESKGVLGYEHYAAVELERSGSERGRREFQAEKVPGKSMRIELRLLRALTKM